MSEIITPENFKALGDEFAKASEKVAGVEKTLGEVEAKMSANVASLAKDVAALDNYLKANYGQSGAKDWKKFLAEFFASCYHLKRYGRLPENLKHMEQHLVHRPASGEVAKAATLHDARPSSGAYSGVFVPTLVWDDIIAIKDIYGTILPRCTQITVPPGGYLRVPMDSTLATAAWVAPGGAAAAMDPGMVFSSATLTPEMSQAVVAVSNELFENVSQSNYMSILGARLIRSIVKLHETAILAGVDSSSGPCDGLVTAATDITITLNAATLAKQLELIGLCVAQHESLYNTNDTVLCTTPAKVIGLMTSTVGASELTGMLAWGSPRDGVPPTLAGYPLIAHPACLVSATTWEFMFHPENVVVATDGPIAIDINSQGATWLSNQVYVRAMQYMDATIGPAATACRADWS